MCVCIHHSEIITAVKSSNSSVGCTSFIHVSVILSCYTKNTMHLGEHSVNLPHENHFHIYLIITERNPERLTKSLWRKGKVLAAKINKRQLGPDAQERLKEQMELKLPQSKCLTYTGKDQDRWVATARKDDPQKKRTAVVSGYSASLLAKRVLAWSHFPAGQEEYVTRLFWEEAGVKRMELETDRRSACGFENQYPGWTG